MGLVFPVVEKHHAVEPSAVQLFSCAGGFPVANSE